VIGVPFDTDSGTFLIADADGALRHWPVPSPLRGSVEYGENKQEFIFISST
jgi:hypothetical protein